MPKLLKIFAPLLALVAIVGALALTPERAGAATGVAHDVIKTVSTSISSEATVATPGSGKVLVLRSCELRSSGSGVVVFKDNTAGTTIMNQYLIADTPLYLSSDLFGHGLRLGAADHVLTATLSGATLTAVFRCDEE